MSYPARKHARVAFVLAFLSVLLLQQVCVPGFPQVSIQAPIFLAVALLLMFAVLAKIKKTQSVLLAVVLLLSTLSMLVSSILSDARVSPFSFLYFLALYSVFFIRFYFLITLTMRKNYPLSMFCTTLNTVVPFHHGSLPRNR